MARAGTASRTSALTDAITSWFSGVALGGGIGAIIRRHRSHPARAMGVILGAVLRLTDWGNTPAARLVRKGIATSAPDGGSLSGERASGAPRIDRIEGRAAAPQTAAGRTLRGAEFEG
jgi:hypothetical protein